MPTVLGVRQLGQQSGVIELGQDKVVRRYSLEYAVKADNTSQGPLTIRSTTGLPKVGLSTYSYNGESDPYAVCKRKAPTRNTKQPLIWVVRCDFDNDADSQSQENENDDQAATARPATIEWDAEFGDEVLTKDFSAPRKDVVNPVGLQFDPPVTRRVIYPVLTIQRYEATFNAATILAYIDRTNANAFYGAAAGQALMARIRARQVVEDGDKLWSVTYRIRFAMSPDGHNHMPLNQSTHYKDGANLLPFEKGGVPYIGNLNLDGTAAPEGTRTYGGSDGNGFVGNPRKDFGPLNLE